MLPNPDIDPVLLRLGPIAIRWYGLMYVFGLTAAFFMIKARAASRKVALSLDDLHDLILYAAVGVILGGRLGYILFYNLPYYLDNPFKFLAVWEGGMSFHGGLLGVIVAVGVFCRRKGHAFYTIADLAAPAVPVGLGVLFQVAPVSVQLPVNCLTSTAPGVPIEVTHSFRTALDTFAAVVPVGSVAKLNVIIDHAVVLTFRVVSAPLRLAGSALLTYVSAMTGASVADTLRLAQTKTIPTSTTFTKRPCRIVMAALRLV